MKKILVSLLALTLVFSLSACSWGSDETADQTNPTKDINEGLDEFEYDEVDVNATLNTNQPELTEEEEAEALTRDEQRLIDVAAIEDALAEYLAANGNYPETYDELIPDYLEVWPEDPGEFKYIYTPIGSLPARFYDVGFELEVGVGDWPAGLSAESPDEIAE